MSDDPPSPPIELPTELVSTLDGCTPDQLRRVAHYSEELAEYKSRREYTDQAVDKAVDDEPSDDRPNDVPPKATITIKKINNNRYYYWQWREGEKIESKYKGPVK